MKVNNPVRAAEIADELLVIAPEYEGDAELVEFGATEALSACALQLNGEGLNIASLTSDQWRERIGRMVGTNDPDTITDLYEGLVSWAQTDDDPDAAPSLEVPLPLAAESWRTR